MAALSLLDEFLRTLLRAATFLAALSCFFKAFL
jgi:hypothetical protein